MTCQYYIPQKDNAGVPSLAPVSLWCRGTGRLGALPARIYSIVCAGMYRRRLELWDLISVKGQKRTAREN